MGYRTLLASTAILLAGTTAALADCASLGAAYLAASGSFSDDVTLTNPDGTIECEFEAGGILVGEEIILADGTRIEREYDSAGKLLEEEIERDEDEDEDDRAEEEREWAEERAEEEREWAEEREEEERERREEREEEDREREEEDRERAEEREEEDRERREEREEEDRERANDDD